MWRSEDEVQAISPAMSSWLLLHLLVGLLAAGLLHHCCCCLPASAGALLPALLLAAWPPPQRVELGQACWPTQHC